MLKYILFALFLAACAGCAAAATQQEPGKYYNVYDEKGQRKGYIKEQDGTITIYNDDWKRKGYIQK